MAFIEALLGKKLNHGLYKTSYLCQASYQAWVPKTNFYVLIMRITNQVDKKERYLAKHHVIVGPTKTMRVT